jgi:hypothetical protein
MRGVARPERKAACPVCSPISACVPCVDGAKESESRWTTVRPTDDDIAKGLPNIQIDRTIAGFSPAECIRLFHSDCRDMKSEYLSVRTDFNKNVLSALDQTWELHRSGWMLTPEYIQFCQKLRAFGIVNIGQRTAAHEAQRTRRVR